MTAHGPDAETFERASAAELKPHKLEDTMAFMFESRFAMRLTRYAMESSELQHDYFEGWQGLERHFPGSEGAFPPRLWGGPGWGLFPRQRGA